MYSYPIYHLSSLSIYSLNEDATSESSVSSESDSVQQAQISATEVNIPKRAQQPHDSETLPSQQQSPMAAPATEHQPTPSQQQSPMVAPATEHQPTPSQQQSPMAAPATEHQPIATSSATGQLAIDGE